VGQPPLPFCAGLSAKVDTPPFFSSFSSLRLCVSNESSSGREGLHSSLGPGPNRRGDGEENAVGGPLIFSQLLKSILPCSHFYKVRWGSHRFPFAPVSAQRRINPSLLLPLLSACHGVVSTKTGASVSRGALRAGREVLLFFPGPRPKVAGMTNTKKGRHKACPYKNLCFPDRPTEMNDDLYHGQLSRNFRSITSSRISPDDSSLRSPRTGTIHIVPSLTLILICFSSKICLKFAHSSRSQ
jgi:hypothetical protein